MQWKDTKHFNQAYNLKNMWENMGEVNAERKDLKKLRVRLCVCVCESRMFATSFNSFDSNARKFSSILNIKQSVKNHAKIKKYYNLEITSSKS